MPRSLTTTMLLLGVLAGTSQAGVTQESRTTEPTDLGKVSPAAPGERARFVRLLGALKAAGPAEVEAVAKKALALVSELEPREPGAALRLLEACDDLWARLDRWEPAARVLERGRALARKHGWRLQEGRFTGHLAHHVNLLGRHEEALRLLTRSIELFTEVGDDARLAVALQARGDYAGGGFYRFEEAFRDYDRAAAIMGRLGLRADLGALFMRRGTLAVFQRDYEAVVVYQRKALAIFEELGGHELTDASEKLLADALTRLGRLDEADEILARSRERLVREGKLALAAEAAQLRAENLEACGRLDDALAALDDAGTLARRADDPRRLVKAELFRARVHLARHEPELAERSLVRAEDTCRAVGDPELESQLHLRRGGILAVRGRLQEALRSYDAALTVLAGRPPGRAVGHVHFNRAGALAGLGRYRDALAAYVLAESHYRDPLDAEDRARVAVNRAFLYERLGRWEEALEQYALAEPVFTRLNNWYALATIRMNRGTLYCRTQRYEDALEELGRADELFVALEDDDGRLKVALNRGLVLDNLGQHERALAVFARAEEICRARGDAERLASFAMNRAATFRAMGRTEEALLEARRAEEMLARFGREETLAENAFNQGLMHNDLEQWSQALVCFARAAGHFDRFLARQAQPLGRRTSESLRGAWTRLAGQAVKAVSRLEAPDAEELDRAYFTLQVIHGLGTAEALAGDRAAADLTGEERAELAAHAEARRGLVAERDRLLADDPASERLPGLAAEIARLDRESAVVLERARLRDPLAAAIEHPRGAHLADVQAAMPVRAALVEYLVRPQGAFAFVVRTDRVDAVALGDGGSLIADVDRLDRLMKRPGTAVTPSPVLLRRLGRKLLDPVLALLGDDVPSLLIAAHGEACRLPFELLLTDQPERGEPVARWPFLVRTRDVGYVHSGTVLLAMRRAAGRDPAPEGPELVAFGFPFDEEAESDETGRGDLDRGDLEFLDRHRGRRSILHASAEEVLAVARLFASDKEREALAEVGERLADDPFSRRIPRLRGRRFEVRLRMWADEGHLKTSADVRNARILHFACHGEADLTSPRLSRLVLARSPVLERRTGEDGYVDVAELMALRLNAELVVLSACSTNDGVRSRVEGLKGLSRAALAAGARNVVSTLWAIDDDSAVRVMEGFYRHHVEGGATLIRSLAEAKRDAIRAGIPPRTWSAYLLWTDGSS